jgi:gamma-glutamyltranspeptidase/glutathione hydrolase
VKPASLSAPWFPSAAPARAALCVLVTAVLVLAAGPAPTAELPAANTFNPTAVALGASRDGVHGERGVVASRSRLASEAGVAMLRQGGTAIDAAVATAFALAVTYPSAGNIGGGGFMVIRLADGTLITNDHRERAPLAADRDMFLDAEGEVVPGLSRESHLASGVPGSVAGLLDVLERFGTLPREQVMAPAIRLAEEGFALNYDLANQFTRRLEIFARHAPTLAKFTAGEGRPYVVGEVFRQPDLAATLRRIASEGKAGFYQGRTAELLVEEMRRGGGIITHEDLAAYTSVWREPIIGTYRDHQIVSMPPPSSGGVLLVQMLNMLEAYPISTMGYGSAAAVHLMVEAERRAYADRAEHLGDSDFYDVPIQMLTSKDYARQRMETFDPAVASRSDDIRPGEVLAAESMQTTHLSAADADGNAVAYTTTLNLSYGARYVIPGAGFLMNNEMDDFSVKANTPNAFGLIGRKANEIAGGKRMLSSMTPTLVLKDGEPMLITGSPGGSTIITTVLQVIVNTIDHGMALRDAVGQPRFHHQWKPERVIHEPFGLSPDTLAILKGLGHDMRGMPGDFLLGDANSIRVMEDGSLLGVSDPRNEGGAVGY